MVWYHEAIFYHIYPLGMLNAEKYNPHQFIKHRLNELYSWIDHIKTLGCNTILLGPVFESSSHGYDTIDYKKVDSRLGSNDDLKDFIKTCHQQGIKVILDGVFNHVGRDFFAFQDLKSNRENSSYVNWFNHVNFKKNNSYHDGFCYDNWGGHDALVKLNQKNSEVINYIKEVLTFWIEEFDIDGIRLDAADVLNLKYIEQIRKTTNVLKREFFLMGEVVHGKYGKWISSDRLHSVTNYVLHEALYSSHNEHNYEKIIHALNYVNNSVKDLRKLYLFVDNHDVTRICSKLNNKIHFMHVHILLFTLQGIPSIYYGSEFAISGKKQRYNDDLLRPALNYHDYYIARYKNLYTRFIMILIKLRKANQALIYGNFKVLYLTFSPQLK